MKRLVNLVQLVIIAAILYPMYYVWETGKIEEFCQQIKPGMTQTKLLELADSAGLSIVGPNKLDPMGAQWVILIPAKSSFSGYACEVKGSVESIAYAKIIND